MVVQDYVPHRTLTPATASSGWPQWYFRKNVKVSEKTALAHVEAAVDVEDLAGDVGGFVARKEDDGGGYVGFRAEPA
jgi:hypothetical protein